MKAKIFLNKDKELESKEITMMLHGSGDVIGMANVKTLVEMINGIPQEKTAEGIIEQSYVIVGYTMCCINAGFLDEESGKRLIDITYMLVEKTLEKVKEKTLEKVKREGETVPTKEPVQESESSIKCNCKAGYGKCIVDMNMQETLGGAIACSMAEKCNFSKSKILKNCEHAEPYKPEGE